MSIGTLLILLFLLPPIALTEKEEKELKERENKLSSLEATLVSKLCRPSESLAVIP